MGDDEAGTERIAVEVGQDKGGKGAGVGVAEQEGADPEALNIVPEERGEEVLGGGIEGRGEGGQAGTGALSDPGGIVEEGILGKEGKEASGVMIRGKGEGAVEVSEEFGQGEPGVKNP